MFSKSELADLLRLRGTDQADLFAQASIERDNRLGPFAVLRGVVEVTNVCRVDCEYCPMRRSNLRMNDRFTLEADSIVAQAQEVVASGINVIFLQGGETPAVMVHVEEAIRRLRAEFQDTVEILLNLGSLGPDRYQRLRAAGADSYILKHETGDPALHLRTRRETLDDRLSELEALKSEGFSVGTGIISSLPGQTFESIVDDLILMHELDVDMCSVSPFIPAPNTPLSECPQGDVDLALNAMSILRLMNPGILLPSVSALEKIRPGGQVQGFNAGANVMTINFSSKTTRDRYLIYGKNRYVVSGDHAFNSLTEAGLTPRGSLLVGSDLD